MNVKYMKYLKLNEANTFAFIKEQFFVVCFCAYWIILCSKYL